EQSPTARPFGSEPVTGPSSGAYYARAIETIQTGQRVLARNPELAGVELPDAPVNAATWVNIRLRMPKPTGDFLEITLLRPVEWLAEHLAQTTARDGEYPRALAEARGTDSTSGSTTVSSVMPTGDPPELSPGMIEPITADSSTQSPWIFLTLHELEAVGPAEIVGVGPCPELEPGEGRLVTGTFSHQSGEVFDIAVDGLTEPIGCTGAHPFWSEDRHEFIPARALRPGETLRTESGTLRQITRITPRRGPPVSVFNFEVDAEHVYYVSVDGVLVHNTYVGSASQPPRRAHVIIGELDELGRPTGVNATITQDLLGTGSDASRLIIPPGFEGQASGHARGHLLGNQLGGSGRERRNLITMFQNPANSPVMRDFENQLAAAVRRGEIIDYWAIPIYQGSHPIPIGVTLLGRGSGGFSLGISLVNRGR
ncbi:MAG: DNA/RNA non-specific endonuclease, partial [Planctomycetaceae bacterium]